MPAPDVGDGSAGKSVEEVQGQATASDRQPTSIGAVPAMSIRLWGITCGILGILAVIMLTVLIVLAFPMGLPSSPRFTVGAIVTLTLFSASIASGLLTLTIWAFRCEGGRQIDGVRETVDRLAAVLPPDGKIRRIGG